MEMLCSLIPGRNMAVTSSHLWLLQRRVRIPLVFGLFDFAFDRDVLSTEERYTSQKSKQKASKKTAIQNDEKYYESKAHKKEEGLQHIC